MTTERVALTLAASVRYLRLPADMPEKTWSPVAAILLGGLIAGTIDVGAAALIN
jgi:hypothetical protein